MSKPQKIQSEQEALLERCAMLEEKNRDLIARILTLSEENRASESLLRVLLEFTPFGIMLLDDKRRVIQINKAAERILQLERVNVIGKTCDAIFNCYTQDQCCPVLDKNKKLDRVESDCRTSVCQCDKYLLRSVVRIDNNNETVLVEAFVDISPIKQAQLEIENANQTKDNFLARVSHELRTPLNAIIGFTELLQDSFADKPDLPESLYLHNMMRSSKALLRMVDEILDITRITANKLKLDEYQVEIAGFVKQLCEEFSEPCAESNNRLSYECTADIVYLYTDPFRLHQILFHILENACKFTRNGEIELLVSRQTVDDREWVAFRVKDNGQGMEVEQVSRIFEEFEQLDAGLSRRYGGTGLGLSLCSRISALMGGKMAVSSKPGEGTEVMLYLPARASAD